MERAAPPRRWVPNFGDAVSVFAALLGVALLVATARHLFLGDAAVEAVPSAAVVSTSTIPAERAQPGATRQNATRHDATPQNRSRVAPRQIARRAMPANEHQRATPRALGRHAPHRAQPIARVRQQRPIAKAPQNARPLAHGVAAAARPASVRELRLSPRSAMRRAAARPSGHLAPRPAPPHSVARPVQRAPAQRAFVAARVARSGRVTQQARAHASRAAIIEPPLGYQAHATLVELPAALGLDLGRDPVPALLIRLKHRH